MKFALLIVFSLLLMFCKLSLQTDEPVSLQQMQVDAAVCNQCSDCYAATGTSLAQDNDSTEQDVELLTPDDDSDDELVFQICSTTTPFFFHFASLDLVLSAFRLQSRFLEAATPPPPNC